MRIAKIRDTVGCAVVATARVIPDHNGAMVSKTSMSGSGRAYLKFKVKGASRLITRSDGSTMWKSQRMWCEVLDDSPFAETVKSLGADDEVFLFGTLVTSKYTTEAGRERQTTFCKIEYIQPIKKPSGGWVADDDDAPTDDDDDIDF